MASLRRRLSDALTAMDEASSYHAWLAAADEHDELTGMAAWRREDDSEWYDARRLRDDLAGLATLRAADDPVAVSRLLDHSLTRHHGDITAMPLMLAAFGGTKDIIRTYVDTVCDTLLWIARHPRPGVSEAERLRRFKRAARHYGRACLMLSGGGTLGWIHLGVVKVLFEQQLLPNVVTGASMGAMIAAGICARDDDELRVLFDDPREIRTFGLKNAAVREGFRRRALLDPEVLRQTILHNCGDETFEGSYLRTGRRLCISVSPTRRGQRPRLLNHLTAPDVLIAEAALASSSIPGVLPPAKLMCRHGDGRQPYLEDERWIDGSIHGDMPKWRVGRLFNVNHFVVSQTNPHVVPFLWDPRRRGLWRWAMGLTGRAVLQQGRIALSTAAHLTADTPLRSATTFAHALVDQDYLGDVAIHPRFHPRLLRKAFTNASFDELLGYVRLGEQAAWPHLTKIRMQTQIAHTFELALREMEARVEAAPTEPVSSR